MSVGHLFTMCFSLKPPHMSHTDRYINCNSQYQQISKQKIVIYFPKDLQYKEHLYTFQLPFSINHLILQLTYSTICTQTTHNPVTLLSNFDVCVCCVTCRWSLQTNTCHKVCVLPADGPCRPTHVIRQSLLYRVNIA